MKKNHSIRNLFLYILMGFMIVMIPMQVRADMKPVSVSIPVTNEVSGEGQTEELDFTFVIEPKEEAPAPEGGQEIVIHGNGTAEFSDLTFEQPGDYSYVIYQKEMNLENYEFDRSTYQATVSVRRSEDGSLTAVIWGHKGDEQEKTDAFKFASKYNTPEIPEIPTVEEPKHPTKVLGEKVEKVVEVIEKTVDVIDKAVAPKTGDSFLLFIVVAVLLLGTGIIVISLKIRRKS